MRYSRFLFSIVSTAAVATLIAPPVHSQLSQTWNVQNRAEAERAISAGVTQLTERQIATAIGAFERASQTDPNDAAAPMMLGMALALQGKYSESLNALQRAFSLQQTAEILNDTGWVYYLKHDYDAAITSWNRALKLEPKLCQMNGNIGFALLRKGRFTDAEAQFRKLVNCKPHSNYGYQGLATVYYMRGNLTQAREAANRAMAQPYAPILLLMAKLDALQGDKPNAIKHAQQSILMAKKNQERSMTEIGVPTQHDFFWDPLLVDSFDNGYLLSARLQGPADSNKQASLAKQGRAEDQIAAAKATLQNFPDDIFSIRALGLTLAANGDYAGAAATFKQVMDLCPQCHVDLLHLARALSFQGDTAGATAAVASFNREHPEQHLSPAFDNIAQDAVSEQSGKQPPKSDKIKTDKRKADKTPAESDVVPANDF